MAGIVHKSANELEQLVRNLTSHQMNGCYVMTESELETLIKMRSDLLFVAGCVDPLIEELIKGPGKSEEPTKPH